MNLLVWFLENFETKNIYLKLKKKFFLDKITDPWFLLYLPKISKLSSGVPKWLEGLEPLSSELLMPIGSLLSGITNVDECGVTLNIDF